MHEPCRLRHAVALAAVMLALPALGEEAKTAASVDFHGCARPEWPKEALRLRQQGVVQLGFLVTADGAVADSKILRSSGFPLLDAAARDSIMKCRFKAAAQSGQPAETWLNIQYVWTLDPRPGAAAPFDKAAAMAAMERGDPKARVALARHYMTPGSGDFDPTRGVELLRAGVAAGEPAAMERLASLHATGIAVPKDPGQSMALYRQAAESGLASSQTTLGVALLRGDGVPKNAPAGEEWLRKAAAQGHARARAWLASLLLDRGAGVPEALGLLKEAATQGDPMAQRLLGWCNEQGTAMPQDYTAAAGLYRKAAAAGDNAAKKGLARLYGRGLGVPQDKAVADALERDAAAGASEQAALAPARRGQ